MKQARKYLIVENQTVNGIIREKNILSSLDHPFIIKLYATYQDRSSVYFLLELVQGGELFTLIHSYREKGLPQDYVAFYSMNVALALTHLHSRNVIYRDLKPENILIDAKTGYCKLVDFGFAKVIFPGTQTFTLCGTPEYLAPEVILPRGHDKAVDLWSLGVLIYELSFGETPFHRQGMRQDILFGNIISGKIDFSQICFRSSFTLTMDIINRLLKKEGFKRLGFGKNGEDLLNHPFFHSRGLNVANMLHRSIVAPWRPHIIDKCDASCFGDFSRSKEERRRKDAERRTKLKPSDDLLFSEF